MNLDEYQEQSREMMAYPKAQEVGYLALKLISEWYEVKEALTRPDRNGHPNKLAICHEIGDTFWYLARFADLFEVSLANFVLIDSALNDFTLEIKSIESLLKDLSSNCGKHLRGDFTEKELYLRTFRDLKVMGTYLAYLGSRQGYGIEIILSKNIEKLTVRKANNKIKGDGSDR